ncbi:MAG: hypothetical protein K2X35_22120 [Bryobacteraceae bacterium]|nr:hypothetical protein [Bryobacteraceae bacterium]
MKSPIALLLILMAGAAGLGAQPPRGFQPQRLGNGKPDFNGIWQALGPFHYDVERHMARPSLMLRDGPYGPLPAVPLLRLGAVGSVPGSMGIVEGGKIPYKPEAQAKREENRKNWLDRDPEVKCYLPGIPRATYMPFPFQIAQNNSSFFIAYEYAGAVRDILFQDPGPAETDSWMGQSVGRWEGDTLVVVTTGLNDQTWFDRSGTHHSNQLKVTERFTMMSPNHIRYEATMEDPEVFTAPWKISLPLYRRMEPDARLMDFKCVEFVEELMFGEYRRKPLPR